MADSRHNGNVTGGDTTGGGKRHLSRSRNSGLSMVDGGKAAGSGTTRHAATAGSTAGSGATRHATAGSTAARPARRDGNAVGRADGSSATVGNAGSRAGARQAGRDGGVANGSRHDPHAGMQAGGDAHGSKGGVGIPRATWSSGNGRDADRDAAVPSHAGNGAGTNGAVRGAVSRTAGVAGDGMASGRYDGDAGVIGRVSGSRAASGDGYTAASGDGAVPDDGAVYGGGGFTDEERRLYEEAHAPLGDRMRRALADSSVPLVCVIVIGVAIALRFLMAFSSAVLTVLAIGVGIILMGSIIYITYEDQRKANALADEAEMLYAAKSRIEGKSKRRREDGSDGADSADGTGDDGGVS